MSQEYRTDDKKDAILYLRVSTTDHDQENQRFEIEPIFNEKKLSYREDEGKPSLSKSMIFRDVPKSQNSFLKSSL